MKGYPKHLNSKQDYYYVVEHFAREHWEKDWEALRQDAKVWINIGVIKDGDDGIVNDAHKVHTQVEKDNTETRYQYALVDNDHSLMKRLGITEEEINAVLNVTKTVVSLIFPLITFPYSSHVLGVEAIGRYNFSASIVSYFTFIGDQNRK